MLGDDYVLRSQVAAEYEAKLRAMEDTVCAYERENRDLRRQIEDAPSALRTQERLRDIIAAEKRDVHNACDAFEREMRRRGVQVVTIFPDDEHGRPKDTVRIVDKIGAPHWAGCIWSAFEMAEGRHG